MAVPAIWTGALEPWLLVCRALSELCRTVGALSGLCRDSVTDSVG